MSIQMKFCPSCGGKLPEPTPKFCPNCGAPLQANSVPANIESKESILENKISDSDPQNSNFIIENDKNNISENIEFDYFAPKYEKTCLNLKKAIGIVPVVLFFLFDIVSLFESILMIFSPYGLDSIAILPLQILFSIGIICCLDLVPLRYFWRTKLKDKFVGRRIIGTLILVLMSRLAFSYLTHEFLIKINFDIGVILAIFCLILTYFLMRLIWRRVFQQTNAIPVVIKIPGKDYFIGKFPVTQQEYFNITGKDPSGFKTSTKLPVERVSWNEAMAFCEKLTAQERGNGGLPAGYKYTLPTSEQWEFACRADTTTRFYSGDSKSDLDRVAWYLNNSNNQTHPVGQKFPNAFGLYDMHGNVCEWCIDEKNDSSKRISCGGSWAYSDRNCESLNTKSWNVNSRYNFLGFRVALVPEK